MLLMGRNFLLCELFYIRCESVISYIKHCTDDWLDNLSYAIRPRGYHVLMRLANITHNYLCVSLGAMGEYYSSNKLIGG